MKAASNGSLLDNNMETQETKTNLRLNLIVAATLSLFWVIFLWRFWEHGFFVLGLNATVFLGALFYYFVRLLKTQRQLERDDFFWIIPIALIILSYLFYDNPFLKMTNFLVLPATFLVFYSQAWDPERRSSSWGIRHVFALIERAFSLLGTIPSAAGDYLRALSIFRGKGGIFFRVILGLLILFIAASALFLPLLSSADPIFASKIDFISRWVEEFFAMPWAARSFVFLLFSMIIAGLLSAFARPFKIGSGTTSSIKLDQLVAGIVIGGILLLYALFIWVQLERLFTSSLPIDFRETETFVKSGFWQLLALSLINIAIHLIAYRDGRKPLKRLLFAFALASLLLLVSAAQRMFLYVYYYGLSYEKFFATYAVIYCIIFFLWLIYSFVRTVERDMLKFLCQLFLVMYALATITPIEQIILNSNIALSKRPDSRIVLYELNMLSPDVLATVKEKVASGELLAADWEEWTREQEGIVERKRWYEGNMSSLK